jgi:hypothetical protein
MSGKTALSDGMRRPVSAGCDKLPRIDALEGAKKRRPAMKKTSRAPG